MPSKRQRRNRSFRRNPKRNYGVSKMARSLDRLPQITATPINRMTARYGGNISIAMVESVITLSAQQLLFMPGAIATSSSAYASIGQSIRIKSIDVWANAVINGSSGAAISSVSVGVAWYSSFQSASGRVQTDTSMSYASPAHVHAVPERGSLCSFWTNQVGNAPLLDLVLNATVAGSVIIFLSIDVNFDWIVSNQSYAVLSKTSGTTLTTGSAVYPPLDGPGGYFSRLALPAVL
jgi:hypothetical protein